MKTIAIILIASALQLRAAIPSMEDLTNVVTHLFSSGALVQQTNYTYVNVTNLTYRTITNQWYVTNTTQVYVTNNIYNITNSAVVTNVTYTVTNSGSFAPVVQATNFTLASVTNIHTVWWPMNFTSTNYATAMSFANTNQPAPAFTTITSKTESNMVVRFYDCYYNNFNYSGRLDLIGVRHTE